MWRQKDRNRKAFENVKRTVVCGAVENGGQAPRSFALQDGLSWKNECNEDRERPRVAMDNTSRHKTANQTG